MPTTTLLFADQVGSTTQLGLLGDQDVVPVRRTLTDGLQEAVAASGGRVLTVEGDGLFAAFQSAVDAVDAAVAMHVAVALSNLARPPARQVAIRVGLHTGEPVENERGDLYGLAVVVARRLCDEAGPGEIVTSDLVRALVEPRRQHEFTDLGTRPLKGLDDPVAAVGVRWWPRPPQLPIPESVPRVTLPPGSVQLGVIGDLWQEAAGGRARIVAAGGPPSRRDALTAGLAEQAARDLGVVFWARATSPSASWTDVLRGARHYLDGAPTALVRMQAGAAAGLLLAESAARADRFTTVRPASGAPARAYLDLVHAVAAVEPLLLVVDDAHHASNEVVTVLNQAVADGADGADRRLLVVLLYEPDGLARAPALQQVVARGQALTTTPLPEPPRAGRPTQALPPSAAREAVPGPVSAAAALGLEVTTQVDGATPPPAAVVLPDGRRVPLPAAQSVVGRLPGSTVEVDDIDVSRRHAVIRPLGPNWIIEDLASTNGTFVNEVPVHDLLLVHGDVIRVGATQLRFESAPPGARGS